MRRMRSVLRKRLRQLLDAFADAGQPSATGLQLLVGPNGVLVWTQAPEVDRSEPYAGAVLAVSEKSTAPVDRQSPVRTPSSSGLLRPEEPVEPPVYAQLEAPVSS